MKQTNYLHGAECFLRS